MRIVGLMIAGASIAAAAPAAAQAANVPGPFSCTIGDVQLMLYPDDGARSYSGTYEVGGESGESDLPQERVTLRQRFDAWRYVYSSADLSLVIAGDSATLYGDFGESECFASRSTPVGEGWQIAAPRRASAGDDAPRGDWQVITRVGETWTEQATGGSAVTWGGNVRSGPGTEFGRVTGVPLGVEVRLLGKTDRTWLDSYPWYRVRLPNGREGYIAGGLLCTRDGREGFFNQRNCEG